MSCESTAEDRPRRAAPVVEYCVRNVSRTAREQFRESSLDADETACLGRCGDCFAGPFLVIDGEYVSGSHEELLAELEGNA